ncbi:MAG: PQQ-binding-like beta-propeller repeat protein [Nitrososphaera sp.]
MRGRFFVQDERSGKKAISAMLALTVAAFLLAPMAFAIQIKQGYAASADGVVTQSAGAFNKPGNLLITDQFNNRVIEVDPATKQIVWSFGSGNSNLCNPGPHSVIGSNDAERLGDGLTLIAGTGIPPGVNGTTACADNRVIVVDQAGNIVWQYGQAGVAGNGTNLLNVPVFAIQTPNHDIMITDQANNRVIEVNKAKNVVWSYGPTSGPGALNSPNSAELLPNGHILIADEGNNRVIEITRAGQIVWQFGAGISGAAFASRLPNGDTLITDAGNSRIFEINAAKHIVFQYFTNRGPHSNPAPTPTNAVRLSDGNTIIADQNNDRAIIINPSKHIVFQYGMTNVAGNAPNQLFGPYTAYIVGDYTGQTPPPIHFG